VVATLIAVYGAWLVTPLGWKYAGIVWSYAFAWFLVTDPVKLLAYKVLDTVKSEAKPEVKAEPKPEAKAEPEPDPEQTTNPAEAKSEARPDVKAEAKPDAKPQPAAEPEPESAAKAAPEAEPKPDAKAELATLLNTSLGDLLIAGLVKDPEDAGRIIAAAVSQAKASITAPKAPETDAASKAKPQGKAEPAVKSEAQPDGKSKTPADVMP
jgi:H+-transporting ATPase